MNKMEDLYPLILDAFSKDLAFTFPIHGTSMLPLLRTNDLVTLKKSIDHLRLEILYYLEDLMVPLYYIE